MKSVIDENCVFFTQPIALARSRDVIEEKRQSEKRKSNRTDSRRDRTYDGKKIVVVSGTRYTARIDKAI